MQDWEWFDDSTMLWFFLNIVLMANWENKQWHGIEIKRGQFVSTIEYLRFRHGHGKRKKRLTTKQVRTLISRLKSTNELASESTNQFTLYTIVKYNDYQDIDQQNIPERASEGANEGQTKGKRRATTKEYKNYKNDKNISPSKIKHLDSVLLSQDEFLKLEKLYGMEGTKTRIEELNLGIMSKGYKYKSHYHTILAWDRRKTKSTDSRGPGLTCEEAKGLN